MGAANLVIVGLDGATYDLIIPWVEAGRLKTFETLLKGGTWGELWSTLPPLTCPAWPAFMTGKNPGKFGINDFVTGGNGGKRVVNFSDILGDTFWDFAGREGIRSIVVNVPVTYPPQIVNGILLSGMMTPPGKPCCSSEEVINNLREAVGEYIVDLDIATLSSLNRKRSLQKLYTMMENRYRSAMYLLNNYPCDLLVVVFRAPDIVCHRLWDRKDVLLRVFEMIDGYLKSLLEYTNNLFVMSDHGFGSFSKGIRLNQYLLQLGVLVKKEAQFNDGGFYGSTNIEKEKFGSEADWLHRLAGLPWEIFLKLGITRNNLGKALARIGLYGVLRTYFPRILRRALPTSKFTVDREKSKAYLDSRRTRGITINQNSCGPQQYLELREYIKQSLLDLKDPESGSTVIRRVFPREDIYSGDNVTCFPDLYVEPAENYLLRDDFGDEIIFNFPAERSNHHPRGMFLAYGADIAGGKKIEDMKIIDIAPTSLHLLNVAVPNDMDGNVFVELFKRDSSASTREVKYAPSLQTPRTKGICISREDESAIMESLRALGYME